jgi:hypothetical protein
MAAPIFQEAGITGHNPSNHKLRKSRLRPDSTGIMKANPTYSFVQIVPSLCKRG